jgi:hypothetical protein
MSKILGQSGHALPELQPPFRAINGQPSRNHLTASPQAAVHSFSNAELFKRLRSRSPEAAC